jgi:hypothetical protein
LVLILMLCDALLETWRKRPLSRNKRHDQNNKN